jgi:pimeloyl-ACP methyl ester carboxylesterase
MDATGTERAALVSLSRGEQRALLLAAEHPERVLGAAFIGPFFPVSPLGGLRWRIWPIRGCAVRSSSVPRWRRAG